MQLKTKKNIEVEEVIGMKCDVCNKTFNSDDWIEVQEMVSITKTGGYGSRFGDGNTITLDICEECFYNQYADNVVYRENEAYD